MSSNVHVENGSGRHVLLIVPPKQTHVYWKPPLARSFERLGNWDRQIFVPPVHLFHDEQLCLQTYSTQGASYGIRYLIGP